MKNLLSNAIKYTPSGGRVLLRARRENGAMRLAVATAPLQAASLRPVAPIPYTAANAATAAMPATVATAAMTKRRRRALRS